MLMPTIHWIVAFNLRRSLRLDSKKLGFESASVTSYFIVVRICTMRSTLSKCLIAHYSVGAMLYSRSQELIHLVQLKLEHWTTTLHFPLSQALDNHHSTLLGKG